MTDLLDASERAAPDGDPPPGDASRATSDASRGAALPAPVPLAPPTPAAASERAPVPPPPTTPPSAPPPTPPPVAAEPADAGGFAPRLPDVVEHQPRQDQNRPLPGTLPVDIAALQATTTPSRRSRGVGRRVVTGVVKLSVLGGLIAAGVVYGPDLYERYTEQPTDARTLPSVTDGPPAPLSFPAPVVTPAVASATFELSVDGPGGPIDYLVSADFGSATTETVVRRPDAPELQIITVADQALIRRVDDDVWFRTQRGGFPFDATVARQQWVRFSDELFSPEVRSAATIEGAAQHDVDGVPTRHLVVTVPAASLQPPPDLPALRPPMRGEDTQRDESGPTTLPAGPAGGPGDPSGAAVPPPDAAASIDPATPTPAVTEMPLDNAAAPAETPLPAPAPASAAAAPAPGAPPPVGPPVGAPSTVATTVPPPPTTTVEVWIDDAGIVRQGVGSEVFGVDRVRVTSVSADGWAPSLPLEEQIRPLDAEAILHLGL